MPNLTHASEAWKYLNGIFCIYKPPNLPISFIRRTLLFNLCRDLNNLEKRSPKELVQLKGSLSSEQPFSVVMTSNLADHELVSGPRYQEQDIRMNGICSNGPYTSGLVLYAVNKGCSQIKQFGSGTFLRKYEVKGKFGLASKNFMFDGKIMERSTFSHIRQGAMDRLLASIQFTHQALSYRYSGINSQSQVAYELASKGLVRPIGKTKPIIYSISCSRFSLPEFTLEIHCVNETEEFLSELVHQIGVYLKSSAVCTGLRCTQFGHFSLDLALLRKHWTLENILNNITLCKNVLDRDNFVPSTPQLEVLKPSKLKEALEDMQDVMRKEVL